jgi:hypothetical protein
MIELCVKDNRGIFVVLDCRGIDLIMIRCHCSMALNSHPESLLRSFSHTSCLLFPLPVSPGLLNPKPFPCPRLTSHTLYETSRVSPGSTHWLYISRRLRAAVGDRHTRHPFQRSPAGSRREPIHNNQGSRRPRARHALQVPQPLLHTRLRLFRDRQLGRLAILSQLLITNKKKQLAKKSKHLWRLWD